MKRDARLYDIVQSLRDGRLHTASELARRLGVSTRTIWRDMEMLAPPACRSRGNGGSATSCARP
jgi:predicted DNA-binding transcriptional regulator YafY